MKVIDIQPYKKIGGEQYYTIKVTTSINSLLFDKIIDAFKKAGAGYIKADRLWYIRESNLLTLQQELDHYGDEIRAEGEIKERLQAKPKSRYQPVN